MDRTKVYLLTSLVIDPNGEVIGKNVGVTFSLHEAEEHRAKGVENDFETFQIDSNWQVDAATTDLIVALRTFREIVEEQQAQALR
ncbi:MAG TPA: hypothetical protein VEK33_20550 [Terriglobales bacterium]|nr:hypothetical protein [Terriglobales bacterium]